ncbi:transglutaminase family protein [Geothrix sp. PMB-07]|uniref:transglutaminase-like domain-containing protein n=1 Tax=Geothrix sp. PMB-07 TaxID=3068640 RepID=UPI002740810D|nr:transglutaminase-like domain-containing protein [Geothrix sp. PMB-07]WLT30439.1 transglutaminase-like domain-containing protein [Geothrix sp. PMB-07]
MTRLASILCLASAALLAAPAPEAQNQALARGRDRALSGVLRQKLTHEEREALRFLYAGMPLSDLADFDGAFFLEATRASLEARRVAPWGHSIPEDLFRHFVLPPRVNNENLDAFRARYHRELAQRVKGLSMAQAALEINHWCHEKVTYQGTDSRTSGPLSTLRSAFGRCGEESTFTVAALRAVCIPARQVYTPRWAHSDDNHAWVEVWVDGQWHFMGACEPEPELDMGWFREPVRRAMLVHTRAYGPYTGQEPVVRGSSRYAELNLTSHYAPVKTLQVQVRDRAGRPAAGAQVEFQIYNYGEFYPLATRVADAEGRTSLAMGLGDVLLWAHQGEAFGLRKVSVGNTEQVELTLDGDPAREQVLELDQVPPVERPALPDSPAAREANARRLKQEDALRGAYTATFMTREKALALAKNLDLDGERVWKQIARSAGNWEAISAFLSATDARQRPWALPLLESITDKDLRDTPTAVLQDHLAHGLALAERLPAQDFIADVLCPRVDNELLSPYRGYLQKHLPKGLVSAARRNPAALVDWIKTHITIEREANHYRVPLSPRGVLDLRVSDDHSRDLFFVACCRALDLPARLDPALRTPQFRRNGQWVTATFTARKPATAEPSGTLIPVLESKTESKPEGKAGGKTGGPTELKYATHFTLARFEGGRYRTLDLDDERPLSQLTKGMPLPEGHYLAVTGNRVAGGTVLARLSFFNLKAGETTEVPLSLRRTEVQATVLGRLDLCPPLTIQGRTESILSLAGAKGALFIWADPGQEPTRHVMGDLRALKEAFEGWGGRMVLLLPEGTDTKNLGADFERLPAQATLLSEGSGSLLHSLAESTGRSLGSRLPVIAVVDPSGKVIHLSEGYQIGAGEQTLKALQHIQEAK